MKKKNKELFRFELSKQEANNILIDLIKLRDNKISTETKFLRDTLLNIKKQDIQEMHKIFEPLKGKKL